MVNSTAYFSKVFINGIAKIQNKFFENPKRVAELVYGVSDELQKLGVKLSSRCWKMQTNVSEEVLKENRSRVAKKEKQN